MTKWREKRYSKSETEFEFFLKNPKYFDYYGYDFVFYLQKDTKIQYKNHTETSVITENEEKFKL